MSAGVGAALLIKARVFVFLDDGKKLFDGSNLGNGIIAAPFEICPLPEDLREGLSSNEGLVVLTE